MSLAFLAPFGHGFEDLAEGFAFFGEGVAFGLLADELLAEHAAEAGFQEEIWRAAAEHPLEGVGVRIQLEHGD